MSIVGLTPELLLQAYAAGIFPMAETREADEVFWVDPKRRGIIPIDGFHLSRSLRREILRARYRITADSDFPAVVAGCADRDETWINAGLFQLYVELFTRGHAHSVEVWDGNDLVGGIFGVELAGAFFGESMFSRRRDTSKLALAYLIDRLGRGGFVLFDTQFPTDHLRSLGGTEVPRSQYRSMLREALRTPADFGDNVTMPPPQEVVQRLTHTS